MPEFLAWEDIVPVELPSHRSPREAVVLREKTASLQPSLEAEIHQFSLKEEGEEQEEPVIQVLDLEGELDKSSIIHCPKFIVS